MIPGKTVCLGDSLTYGYPYGPRYSWVAHSAKATGLEMINCGLNGDTLEGMAARFDRDVLGRNPAYVVILGGTNDAFNAEITSPMILCSMEQMLKRADACGITTVVGLPIPVDDPWAEPKLKRICNEYQHMASEMGSLILDFRTPFILPVAGCMRDELYLDGVHPNKDGYRVMGETATAFFLDILKGK